MADVSPTCFLCGRPPGEIPVYAAYAKIEGIPPDEFAKEDGTYNKETNHFACDGCYIAIGLPSSEKGWKAP